MEADSRPNTDMPRADQIARFAALATLALLAVSLLPAEEIREDLRSARSPDGKVEIQIFVGQPVVEGTSVLPRMAYRVLYQGKAVLQTSFLGFDLNAQNPIGEKPGLTKSESGTGEGFNWVLCHFLQNGSQGRLYDVEARAYNTGVAFRYHIPWSAPMEYILVENENTEFQFAADARSVEAGVLISDLPIDREFRLPFVVEQPGLPLVAVSQAFLEKGAEAYPAMTVRHDTSSIQGPTMVTLLARLKDKPWIAIDSKPPFVSPWRVISIAAAADQFNPPMR
jgi:alpha-glucosidase